MRRSSQVVVVPKKSDSPDTVPSFMREFQKRRRSIGKGELMLA